MLRRRDCACEIFRQLACHRVSVQRRQQDALDCTCQNGDEYPVGNCDEHAHNQDEDVGRQDAKSERDQADEGEQEAAEAEKQAKTAEKAAKKVSKTKEKK